MWKELYEGAIGKFLYYSTLTPPRLVLLLYGYEEVPSGDNLTALDKVVKEAYEVLVNLFSKIPIFGDLTLADISLFSLMFGLGVLAIIVFSILKWVKPL
jgi:hypothetical protein